MSTDVTNSKKHQASLAAVADMDIYPASVTEAGGLIWAMGRKDLDKYLLIATICGCGCELSPDFEGNVVRGEDIVIKICPLTHGNAVALRKALPFTAPRLVGLSGTGHARPYQGGLRQRIYSLSGSAINS